MLFCDNEIRECRGSLGMTNNVDKFFVRKLVTVFYGHYQETGRKKCTCLAGFRF